VHLPESLDLCDLSNAAALGGKQVTLVRIADKEGEV
jgi:hypothetical protein